MKRKETRRYDLRWRRGNAAALLTLCVLAAAALAVKAKNRDLAIANEIIVRQQRVEAAEERIDPNTASPASIRRLPGIGETLTAAIVEYRRAHARPAFRKADDLCRVRRIGPGTVRRIEKYLEFKDQRDR